MSSHVWCHTKDFPAVFGIRKISHNFEISWSDFPFFFSDQITKYNKDTKLSIIFSCGFYNGVIIFSKNVAAFDLVQLTHALKKN